MQPKADIGESLHPIVVKLWDSIKSNSNGAKSEYPTFVQPGNCRLEMQILHKQLWAWAEAIRNQIPGVDYTHPPHGPQYPNFVWQTRRGYECYDSDSVAQKRRHKTADSPFPTQFPRTSIVPSPHAARKSSIGYILLPPPLREASIGGVAAKVEVLSRTPNEDSTWKTIPDKEINMLESEDLRDVEGFRLISASPHPASLQS
jgi:hypothetical protein